MVQYVEMYKEMREALDAQEVDISPYIDAYSVHHYNLRLDNVAPTWNVDVGRGYFKKGLKSK